MLEKQRKIRLVAWSSMVCQKAGLPGQTLRAQWLWPLNALEKLENHPGFLHFPAFSDAIAITQNLWH